ncbi:ABC transporter substrate-binding protein [Intrasporangium sp.]|uniref:ABC transporter substrate-binding protein n=1 Tax=Intrasporangium sp. TaxID=1925024 RepID=UPI0032218DDB
MTKTRVLIAAAAAVLALPACSLNGQNTPQGADGGGGGDGRTHSSTVTSVISTASSPSRSIERITGAQNPGSQVAMALCEPLTGIDEAGKVFMRAASSVKSTDQKTWTIKLAEGRTFSDGTPITARTWVDTFNFIALGKNAMPSNYAYIDIQGYDALNPADPKAKPSTDRLSGLKVVDDNTFTLTMNKPYNDVPYLLATLPFCPMPASAFKDPTAYDRKPVGNGPYLLSKLDPKVEAVLTLDPKYKGWVPEGAAKTLVFKVFTDTNTAYQDVVAGNTDVLRSLPPGLAAQAKNALGDKGLTAIKSNTLETYILWPTYLDKKFPKEVREAFSMVTNREAISKNLFLGSSKAAGSLMPDSVSAYRADACGATCKFDPEGAKAKIKQAGFTGSIPVLYSAGNTTDAATALAISNEAKKIGLDVEPRPTPAAELGDSINEYRLEGPAITLWGSSFPSASEWIASIMVDANYRLKYQNPTASAEVAKAWAATTTAEADKHWQAAEDSILKDQVIQPLYYQVMYIAHNECVTPHSAGGDMQIYRTAITCPIKD